MAVTYNREHIDIISLGSSSIEIVKTVDADIRQSQQSSIYFIQDLSFASASLSTEVYNDFNFFDAKWGLVSYNEIWEQSIPKLIARLEQNNSSDRSKSIDTITEFSKSPVFIFSSCRGNGLPYHLLPKLIDLLLELKKHPIIFLQRPSDFEGLSTYKDSEDCLKQMISKEVSIILNDLPLLENIPKPGNYAEIVKNNDSIIYESFVTIDMLLEYSFNYPLECNDLLSFFNKQELLFFGNSFANSIQEMEKAVEYAKEQIELKLKPYPFAEIDSYRLVIGYQDFNSIRYQLDKSFIFDTLFSKPVQICEIKNQQVIGEQLSIRLLANVSNLLGELPKTQLE